MNLLMFVVICNIMIGWYNIIRSNNQFKDGDYTASNISFSFALVNIMLALGIIARQVYLEIIW